MCVLQWHAHGGSETAGDRGSLINGAPETAEVLVFFCFLVWNMCHEQARHAVTVGYCTIQLGESPSGSRAEPWAWWVQGVKPRVAPKNLHLAVPKTGSKTDQKHMDGYAFFHVHCSTKSLENSKRSEILNFQVSHQKNVYFLAGKYFMKLKSK